MTGRRSWLRRWWWALFLAALIASHLVQIFAGSMWTPPSSWYDRHFEDEPTWVGARLVRVPECCDDGPIDGAEIDLGVLEWAGPGAESRPPVILLHGAPGQATDWIAQAPDIAASSRRVLAVDRLGFGAGSAWVRCYSARANAHAILALMDAEGIDRAHLVGWSNGGPAILHMAAIAPQRVASLTMLGATGDQRVEGSGSYHFEHAKYAVGYVVVVLAPELLPHFGVLDRQMRHAFIRDFMDTDQRPLTSIMQQLSVPTLILQGRHDPLVPERAAVLHHELIPTSRLVMADAGHLFPFYAPEVGTSWMLDHFQRHDEPGVIARTDTIILAPEPVPAFGAVGRFVVDAARDWPWIALVLIIAGCFLLQPELTAVVCAALVARMDLDFGVAMVGLTFGGLVPIGRRGWQRSGREVHSEDWSRRYARRPFVSAMVSRLLCEQRPVAMAGATGSWSARLLTGFVVGAVLWSLMALVVGQILMMIVMRWQGEAAMVAGTLVSAWLVRQTIRLFTWTGRQLLKAKLTRLVRYEFWPAKVFYAPLVVWLALLAIRHRGVMTFTCVNPGIPKGGGTLGERKSDIMPGFGQDERVLRCVVIESGTPTERADAVDAAVHEPGFDSYPVIIKPDAAQRGWGVKLIRSRADALAYFEGMERRAVAQRYHPGPHECGVLWVRDPDATGRTGHIFSITIKVFQELVGDGEHTVEQLIYRDWRFRAQHRVLLARFASEATRIPAQGERLRLSIAGNHVQGAKFLDGTALITPGLEAAIDELCASFRGVGGGELDYGRFDLRYESDEALARGEFGIVELNGAMAESTNIYDPTWSVWRAYRVLFDQWSTLYELGAWRRASGRRPMSIIELTTTAWGHWVGRRGPSVSD